MKQILQGEICNFIINTLTTWSLDLDIDEIAINKTFFFFLNYLESSQPTYRPPMQNHLLHWSLQLLASGSIAILEASIDKHNSQGRYSLSPCVLLVLAFSPSLEQAVLCVGSLGQPWVISFISLPSQGVPVAQS